jgi:hypothetical protein
LVLALCCYQVKHAHMQFCTICKLVFPHDRATLKEFYRRIMNSLVESICNTILVTDEMD